ncbi:zinc finger protein [Perkinsela sp. CCAP 1560/4]|nr:zinc finger protein [Perkinsela sp. CCAP 1560/4]|eukprot:KNH07642.1 zinc finger protein [Perkinsela sp. CCAP 1560/4]
MSAMNTHPQCQIKIGRNGVQHILFVDIDVIPDFFCLCDERQNTKLELLPINKGIFVWCFCSRTKSPLIQVVGKLTYFILLADQRVEIDCTPLNAPDAAELALTVTVGNVHELIPLDVPFTILGKRPLVSEIESRLGSSRSVFGIAVDSPENSWKSILRNRLHLSE